MSLLHVLTQKEKQYLELLAQKLRTKRIEKKLSQAQVAFEISTGRTHYIKIEQGLVNPGIILLLRLGSIYEIPLSDLLPGESELNDN